MTTGISDKNAQADEKKQVKPASDARLGVKEGNTESKTYTQEEVDALLGKSGQKMKAQLNITTAERDTLRSERDSLKNQLSSVNTEISEAKQNIEALHKDMDELTKDDPDRNKLAQLIKTKEQELQALKDERKSLEVPINEVTTFHRDQFIYSVAGEFVKADGSDLSPEDYDAFKAKADKFSLVKPKLKTEEYQADREQLNDLAETMGLKLKESAEPEEEPPEAPKAPVPFTGHSSGGGGTLTRADVAKMSPEERNKRSAEIVKIPF